MKKFILFLLLLTTPAFAQQPPLPINKFPKFVMPIPKNFPGASVVILKNHDDFKVKKDGSYTMVSTTTLQVKDESARTELSTYKLLNNPTQGSLQIIEAWSETNGIKKAVPASDIVKKTMNSSETGLQNIEQFIIVYNGLQLESKVYYKVIRHTKTPSIPGTFSAAFVYGQGRPEIDSTFNIQSEMPLKFHVRDMGNMYLDIQSKPYMSGTEIIGKMNRFAYFPANMTKDSPSTKSFFPRVQVETDITWTQLANKVRSAYSKRLKEKLPTVAESFLKTIEPKKSDSEKLALIREWIVTNLNYSGRWIDAQSDHIPRSLDQIFSTKVADCKDFALTFLKMAEGIGISGKFAFVTVPSANPEAASLQQPVKEDNPLASLAYFNHVVTYFPLKDKSLYLDPTLPIAQATENDFHLHLFKSWILNPDEKGLQPILITAPSPSKVDVTINQSIDGYSGKAKFELSGTIAQYFQTLLYSSQSSSLPMALATLAGYEKAKDVKVINPAKNDRKSTHLNFEIEFGASSLVRTDKGQLYFSSLPQMPPFIWGYTEVGKKMMPWSFPTNINKTLKISGYFSHDEAESDCITMGALGDYRRKLSNMSEGVFVEETFNAPFDDKDLKAQEKYVGNQGWEIKNCIQSNYYPIVKIDPKDAKQVPFEKDLSENTDLSDNYYKNHSRLSSMEDLRRFETLIKKYPNKSDYWHGKARVFRNLGMINSFAYYPSYVTASKKALDKALEINPSFVKSIIYKGSWEIWLRKPDEAVPHFLKAWQLNPNDYHVNLLGADISYEKNDFKKAVGYYDRAIGFASTPTQKIESRYGKAKALSINAETHAQSKIIIDEILSLDSKDPWTIHNNAILYLHMKDFEKAIELEKKALAISDFGAARTVIQESLAGLAWKILEKFSDPEKDLNYAEEKIREAQSYGPSHEVNRSAAYMHVKRALFTKDISYINKAQKILNEGSMDFENINAHMKVQNIVMEAEKSLRKERIPASTETKIEQPPKRGT